MRRVSRVVLALALGGSPPALGCSASMQSAEEPRPPAPPPLQVSDAEFAAHLHHVLADGSRTEARHAELLGVVRALLLHAAERFDRGADDRALKAILGAMYLVRDGEMSPAVVDAETARALDAAIAKLAARGDDGRSRVLLLLRATSAKGEQLKEIQEHVAALDRWTLESRTGKPIEKAGDAERAAVGRAMFDPTGIDDAVKAISRWIDLAIEHNIAFRETGKRPSPEEATEIARALDSGASTVAALMLRYGDARGAADQVDGCSARRIIDPEFYAALRQAADRDDALSWRALFAQLDLQTRERVGGELGIDREILEAANFGIAVEAYRRDRSHLATAIELSRSLSALGMSEAVPAVLEGALSDRARPSEIALTLTALGAAVDADADVGDLSAARRTIAASKALLERASSAAEKAELSPSVADIRYRMATVLVRGGFLDAARPLLALAVTASPRPGGRIVLASILRQMKQPAEALAELERVVGTPGVDPIDEAEAAMVSFDIHRESGQREQAERALGRAAGAATRALEKGPTGPYRVRAMRTLGRVLQASGDGAAAARAFARALDDVGGDRTLLGATMLEAASAALVRHDLGAARHALKKGVDAGAPPEDLVYGAVWLNLVEAASGAAPDGTAGEILDLAAGRSTWTGKLAGWAKGRVTDDALAKAGAKSETTRVEAAFYVAMAKRAKGGEAEGSLRAVADSPVLDLMEVQIAREVLSPRSTFALPKGTRVP